MNEVNRKKKKRKERILLIVAASVVLLGILAAILVPTVRASRRLDRAERILKEAGYSVVYRSGEGAERPTGNPDVLGRVEGKGGPKGEFITLIKFRDKEIAKTYYNAVKDEYTMTQTAVLLGQYVYYGTGTAYELIK